MVGNILSSDIVGPLLSGSTWSFLAQLASKVSVLVTALIGARVLGVTNFGLFAALQATMLLSLAFWDLGLSPMIAREIAAGQISLRPMLWRAVKVRLQLFGPWLAVYAGILYLIGVQGTIPVVTAIVMGFAGVINATSMLLDAPHQAYLRFRASALALSVGRIVFAALSCLLLFQPPGALIIMATALLLGETVTLMLLLRSLRALLLSEEQTNVAESLNSTARTLQRSIPYALNGLFNLVYNRADVVIVTILAGATQAGLYAPASRVQDALMLVPSMAVAGLTPVAARAFRGTPNRRSIQRALIVSATFSVGLSIPMVVGVYFLLPVLLPSALGQGYAGAVEPTRVLIWAIPFAAVQTPLLSILVAIGRAPATTFVYGGALCTSLIGHLILDARYGAVGAAWASFLRDPVAMLIALGFAFSSWKIMKHETWSN